MELFQRQVITLLRSVRYPTGSYVKTLLGNYFRYVNLRRSVLSMLTKRFKYYELPNPE